MMIRYVSNAGIIFDGDKKIGLDCLCKDKAALYRDTPVEILKEMKLDILIFTHGHSDHFCAEYVDTVFEQNPQLQIYGTEEVIETLSKGNIPLQHLHVVQNGDVLEINKGNIQFLQSTHEGAEYADVQNFTLLINKEDKRLVITGDAAPTEELLEQIAAWSTHIDCLFVPFPYVGLNSTRRLLCKHLNIRKIFAYHLPRPEKDVQGWIANTKRVCEQAKDELPIPIFLEKIGDWHCL